MDINGTKGNDILIGGVGNDLLKGLAGNDRLSGGNGNDRLSGGNGNDRLFGGAGNDTLDGGLGSNTLSGGASSDFYIIHSTKDTIVEYFNKGFDWVESSVSYTLSDNLENLKLTGSSTIGIGNALDNRIDALNQNILVYGGDGNDTLNAMGMGDTLIGGVGNDVYHLNFYPGANAVEYYNEGIDWVFAYYSGYKLGDNLENLKLSGNATSSPLSGYGNDLNNHIVLGSARSYVNGGGGNDTIEGGVGISTLIGGTGNDTLTGGSNVDTFTFHSSSEGIDSVTDFNYLEQDKIQVSISGFGLGENRYEKFAFSSDVLYFDQIAFASLQPGSGFDISRDITFI